MEQVVEINGGKFLVKADETGISATPFKGEPIVDENGWVLHPSTGYRIKLNADDGDLNIKIKGAGEAFSWTEFYLDKNGLHRCGQSFSKGTARTVDNEIPVDGEKPDTPADLSGKAIPDTPFQERKAYQVIEWQGKRFALRFIRINGKPCLSLATLYDDRDEVDWWILRFEPDGTVYRYKDIGGNVPFRRTPRGQAWFSPIDKEPEPDLKPERWEIGNIVVEARYEDGDLYLENVTENLTICRIGTDGIMRYACGLTAKSGIESDGKGAIRYHN